MICIGLGGECVFGALIEEGNGLNCRNRGGIRLWCCSMGPGELVEHTKPWAFPHQELQTLVNFLPQTATPQDRDLGEISLLHFQFRQPTE